MRPQLLLTHVVVLVFASPIPGISARGADWPTWRHDSGRSAASPQQLAGELQLQWWRQLPPLVPAWPEDPRLYFDASYQPVVMGKRMFVASSHDDSVTAYNTDDGAEVWRFYAEGPVRLAPVAVRQHLFFGADDGFFYCLRGESGELIWKHRVAPSTRNAIGNDRFISVWPVRGGPLLDSGKILFTAGVWPFEGTFLYSVNVSQATREKPEFETTTLTDKTPQGYLAASGTQLLIPCGRSVVAGFDRATGSPLSYSYSTHGTTDYHVAAAGRWLFHGSIAFDTQSGQTVRLPAQHPVFTSEAVYFAQGGNVLAYDLKNPQEVETKDRRGKPVKQITLSRLWSLANDQLREVPHEQYDQWIKANPLTVDIRAGTRLYGHQRSLVYAIDEPSAGEPAAVAWKSEIEGNPSSMLAADDKLFIVTEEGRIYCFGPSRVAVAGHAVENDPFASAARTAARGAVGRAERILERSGTRDGYCLVWGVGDGEVVEQLARQSQLHIIGVDPDATKVDRLRRRFSSQGLYGKRVALRVGDPLEIAYPPYLASLILSEDLDSSGIGRGPQFVQTLFRALRPYGGAAFLELSPAQHDSVERWVTTQELARAELKRVDGWSALTRVGALPGSADWTHEYGDPSNTLMSQDSLVRAPLGILWFGGPAASGELFYNRHHWGPGMAVIGGRMFIQGPGKLTAVDVYTGRVLWKRLIDFNENYNAGRRGNDFENVLAGFHFLAVQDGVYLVLGKDCLKLDPATGKELARFAVPVAGGEWGRIRVQGDYLVGAVFVADQRGKLPQQLVVLDRNTGEQRWSAKANLSFPLVAISRDRVFCFDGAIENFYRDWNRKGVVPKAADIRLLKAFDLESGKELWQSTTDMIATWVGYCESRDVLVVSNKTGIEAYRGRDGGELWEKFSDGKGFRGHPESVWDKVIIWNDQLIDQRGPGLAYDVQTGEPVTRVNPLTGEPVDWEFTKAGHHCNYAIASPNLLTFRADSAGYCDIASGNTSRLQGYRSGCRNSLIPANGVLNSPNFAYGCVCGYSLFTSLALTHLPENEVWSYSPLQAAGGTIRRAGINFGAPGDRLADDGTLWLDYPNVGGSSPALSVKLDASQPRWFRRHSLLVEGPGMKWVASSGVEGATRVAVRLGDKPSDQPERLYTVRLYFLEPDELASGERIFSVAIQGRPVLTDLDVAGEAGGPHRSLVKEFRGVRAAGDLDVTLTPRSGQPVISGLEILPE